MKNSKTVTKAKRVAKCETGICDNKMKATTKRVTAKLTQPGIKAKPRARINVGSVHDDQKSKKPECPEEYPNAETLNSNAKTSIKRKGSSADKIVVRNKRRFEEVKYQTKDSKKIGKRKVDQIDTNSKRSWKDKTSESEHSDKDFESDDSVFDPLWCPGDASKSDEHYSDYGESSDESIIDESENMDELLEELNSMEDEEDNDSNGENTEEGWSEFKGRQKTFTFNGRKGLQKQIPVNSTPMDIFLLFVNDEVVNHIVLETNKYAEQTIARKNLKTFARLKKWRPTTAEELKKFFGLLLWMGLVRLGTIAAYWEVKGIYRQTVPRSVMSRNRFQLLLSMLHFSDNVAASKDDRLAKIQQLVDILEKSFKDIFHPGIDIVIDETLVPWRGRLIFRQFLPLKAHKYGVKLFKLCTTDGYTWAIIIYSGKTTTGSEKGLALRICKELTKEIINEGRTLYIDNFYTSYDLAKYFVTKDTHVVGTFRANMKGVPKEVLKAKLKKGEIISREDENGIVVLKWKDARDVRILSTKHAPTLQLVTVNEQTTKQLSDMDPPITSVPATDSLQSSTSDGIISPIIDSTQSVKGQNSCDPTQSSVDAQISKPPNQISNPATQIPSSSQQSQPVVVVTPNYSQQPSVNTKKHPLKKPAKSKPLAVLAYNKGKVGIDLSDQMGSYATTLRKGVKWYRKLGIELLLGTAVVNSWVVYQRVTNKKIHIRTFRELLTSGLLALKDENEKSNQVKCNPKAHQLRPRLNVKGERIRRKCSGFYKKLQKEEGRDVARKRAKMTYTFCEKCPGQPQYCLSCFNFIHK